MTKIAQTSFIALDVRFMNENSDSWGVVASDGEFGATPGTSGFVAEIDVPDTVAGFENLAGAELVDDFGTSVQDDPEADEQRLLGKLPADGGKVTNKDLRESLGWSSEKLYEVRERLLASKRVRKMQGKGGATALLLETPGEEDEFQSYGPGETIRERNLYEPIRHVIGNEWARDNELRPLAVEVTAQQGARNTGGRFTRPDVVAVQIRGFQYVPNRVLDVITFEVKLGSTVDITCVYEALAHRRRATHSYVVIYDESASDQTGAGAVTQEVMNAVESEARAHGIGLIVVGRANDFDTWETRIEAARHEPDPGFLDEFIDAQLSPTAKKRIAESR